MAQEVVGSNPTTHPILPIQRTMGCRQAVRHQTLTLALVGSNPASPAKKPALGGFMLWAGFPFEFTCLPCRTSVTTVYESLAQPVEHLTFNQGVRGSNPRWFTKAFYFSDSKGSGAE